MSDTSLAIEHYYEAKKALKKEIITGLVMAAVLTVALTFVFSVTMLAEEPFIDNIKTSLSIGLGLGLSLPCIIYSVILVFRVVLREITWISLLLLLLLLAFAIQFAPIVATVNISIGHARIRKLKKALAI